MSASSNLFTEILQSSAAGRFYPNDIEQLRAEIKQYCSSARIETSTQPVMAALVPHAGYVFSGPVAGYSFKHISNQNPDTLLFVALSHQGVNGACVFSGKSMRTPLGDIHNDREIASQLLNQGDPFYEDIIPYEGEHSIEVNLPFVQELFPHAKIACVLTSQPDPKMCAQIGTGLARTIQQFPKKRVLILVSSDMSHFPNYHDANRVDQDALQVLTAVNPSHYVRMLNRYASENISNLHCVMCGSAAVLSVLEAAKELGVSEAKVLQYQNSGDCEHGDHDRVVGYGSAAWYYPQETSDTLSTQDHQELLTIARQSIDAHLRNIPYTPSTANPKLQVERGVFVTIKHKGDLRGCLGRFDAAGYPLYQLTASLAAESAANDERFTPLNISELPDTTISISVLTPERKVNGEKDIQIGVHGIKIVNGMMNGTLLPQVASERNWNAIEFLEHTCIKANLHRDAWKEPGTDIFVYEADVFSDDVFSDDDFQSTP